MRQFCISWRRMIFDGSRVAFIICALVFIRTASSLLDEIRLMRGELVEQQTSIRMAVQLQGREISKNLHNLDVKTGVLTDRIDTQSTHIRGQMKDVATTAANASKLEGKHIVEAIQSNAEAQKEAPPAVLPEIRVVPVPEVVIPPPKEPEQQSLVPVPQPSREPLPEPPEAKRKGNLVKRLWSSVSRIF